MVVMGMMAQAWRQGRAIWVARHGNRADFVDPNWALNAARPHDPGLSPDGVEQAKELGRRLAGNGIRHTFSSPFVRALETASHLADALDVRIKVEQGVCEWLNPEWFSPESDWLPVAEMARRFPRVDLAYRSLVVPSFPERDEAADCWPRAARAAAALAQEFDEDFLIVCHASPMMGMIYGLLGERRLLECGLCSFAKLLWNGQAWKLALNETVSNT